MHQQNITSNKRNFQEKRKVAQRKNPNRNWFCFYFHVFSFVTVAKGFDYVKDAV
jgi:hypothetical protein